MVDGVALEMSAWCEAASKDGACNTSITRRLALQRTEASGPALVFFRCNSWSEDGASNNPGFLTPVLLLSVVVPNFHPYVGFISIRGYATKLP